MTIAERLYSLANWLDDCLSSEDYDRQAAAESAVVQLREVAALAATGPRIYTHPGVLTVGIADGWAEPETDPTRIDWRSRQAAAAIPFQVIGGRPVNPYGGTGIRYGRNEMGRWGENLMADALVTVTHEGHRYLLMVERADGYGWAVPGGSVEPGETADQAAARELEEETGLTVSPSLRRAGEPVYVPDPRASAEAWAVTVPVVIDLGCQDALPRLEAGDDARRAAWIPVGSYRELVTSLDRDYAGQVFAAHVGMLKQFVGGAS